MELYQQQHLTRPAARDSTNTENYEYPGGQHWDPFKGVGTRFGLDGWREKLPHSVTKSSSFWLVDIHPPLS